MTNDNASYLYFNKSAQSFTTQGFSGDLLGTGVINAVFNPALTLHQFPRTFGSTFTDTYGINVTIPGASINPLISQINYRRSSVVKDSTDSWGQLTTPHGTFDVLRVHSMEIYTDSILALPLFPPVWQLISVTTDTTHSYSWLGKGGKLAIAEMSFDSLGAPKIFKWTELPGLGVGLDESEMDEAINIFPNPANDMINLKLSNSINNSSGMFYIYNNMGALVHQEGITQSTIAQVDVKLFPVGMYTWELHFINSNDIKRGKIALIR
jgi:hypothetical protein